jgi:excinuclease ABC subunit A
VIPIPSTRRRRRATDQAVWRDRRSLKDIDISIPLNMLTCVTGVSGREIHFVHDVLYSASSEPKADGTSACGAFKRLEGVRLITDAVLVDQAPIGRRFCTVESMTYSRRLIDRGY